jgi:hypothetical protein
MKGRMPAASWLSCAAQPAIDGVILGIGRIEEHIEGISTLYHESAYCWRRFNGHQLHLPCFDNFTLCRCSAKVD